MTPDEQLLHCALELAKVDFRERSQQVIQLALDRSKFLRIMLLIWGTPLVIAATTLQLEGLAQKLPKLIGPLSLVGLSFLLASLANCAVLAAMRGNRNSSNLAASGMNYLRTVYLHILLREGVLEPDETLARITSASPEDPPVFRLIHSSSTDLVLLLAGAVNIIYAFLGLATTAWSAPVSAIYGGPLLGFVLLCHYLILREISFSSALVQK